MNFEVKGQPYFLNFVPSEGRWLLFTPTATGIHKIPVANDSYFNRFVLLPSGDKEPILT